MLKGFFLLEGWSWSSADPSDEEKSDESLFELDGLGDGVLVGGTEIAGDLVRLGVCGGAVGVSVYLDD